MKKDLTFQKRYIFLILCVSSLNLLATESDKLVETKSTVTTITEENIEDLPTLRTIQDIVSLAPGVTSVDNQISVQGGSPYENIYLIDGFQVSNPLFKDSPPFVPVDAFEEIQVMSGSTPAEYGTGTGAVINMVTKSGSNEFHGSASVYYNPDAFSSDPSKGVSTDGTYFNTYFEPSFTLGGPIIPDKLWFFTSASIRQWSPPVDDPDDPSQDHTDFFPYFKFTYHHNDNNQFQLFYNYNNFRYKKDEKNEYWDYQSESSQPGHMLFGGWNYNIGNGWKSDLNVGYTQFGYRYTDSLIPGIEGGESYDFLKDKNANTYFLRFNWFLPEKICGKFRHLPKLGLGYESTQINKKVESTNTTSTIHTYPDFTYTENYQYYSYLNQDVQFNRLSFYIQDNITFGKLTANVGLRYDKETGTWPAQSDGKEKTKEKEFAAYTVISPRVSLTYDITGDGKNVVKTSFARYGAPLQHGTFENANPLAGWGYMRNWTLKNGETITDQKTETTYVPWAMEWDDDYDCPMLTELTLAFEKTLSEDLAFSLNAFFKKQSNLLQTVDGSRLDMEKLIDDNELVWIDYEQIHVNTDVNMDVFQDTNPTRSSMNYIVNVKDADREYWGIQLALDKKFSENWLMSTSYTWSQLKGNVSHADYNEYYGHSSLFQNPNALINARGNLENTFPHQVKVYSTYQLPSGIRFGGKLYIFSGNRYTKYHSVYNPPFDTIENLGVPSIYAERLGNSQLPTFWMLNLGLEKTFKISDTTTCTLFVDGYNITNNSIKLKVNPVIGSSAEGEIERILNPGLFQFGVRVSF